MMDQTFVACLDEAVRRTGVERYRYLCLEHPDPELRAAWRRRVCEIAAGAGIYPPLAEQVANAGGAIRRAVGAFLWGDPVLAPDDVLRERTHICLACEFNGQREAGGIRCTKCGCYGVKLHLATEQCPDSPPRWARWEPRQGG